MKQFKERTNGGEEVYLKDLSMSPLAFQTYKLKIFLKIFPKMYGNLYSYYLSYYG